MRREVLRRRVRNYNAERSHDDLPFSARVFMLGCVNAKKVDRLAEQ